MKNNTEHRRYEVGEFKKDIVKSFKVELFIAGSYEEIKMICRKHCFPKGLCLSISENLTFFAGGSEIAFKIEIFNYPPFVEKENVILEKAIALGKNIVEENYQWSFSIVTPKKTLYFSRRRK